MKSTKEALETSDKVRRNARRNNIPHWSRRLGYRALCQKIDKIWPQW
ncbi:hypothetical protein Hanom_Chr07g00579981 [Helianthus anomalus]